VHCGKVIKKEEIMMKNPIGWFEIPVTDLGRAINFYQNIFGYKLESTNVDGYEMAMFFMDNNLYGASGALVKGDIYIPSTSGTIVYFQVDNIKETLSKIVENGGEILYPEKSIGEWGYIAEFKDSEGNRVALHAF
jgi:predicted enzyme related to lactoylglutathione lyase